MDTYDVRGCAVINDFEKFIMKFSQKHQTSQFLVGFDKGGNSTKLTIHPLLSQSPAHCQVIGLFYACDVYSNIATVFSGVFSEISRLDGQVLEGHCKPLQFFLDSDGPAKSLVEGHCGMAQAKFFCTLCLADAYPSTLPQSQLVFWKHLSRFASSPEFDWFLQHFYLFDPQEDAGEFPFEDGCTVDSTLVSQKIITVNVRAVKDWDIADFFSPTLFTKGNRVTLDPTPLTKICTDHHVSVQTVNWKPPNPAFCGCVLFPLRTADSIKQDYEKFEAHHRPHSKQKSYHNIIHKPLWLVQDRKQVGRRPLHNVLGLAGKLLDKTKQLYGTTTLPPYFNESEIQSVEEHLVQGLSKATQFLNQCKAKSKAHALNFQADALHKCMGMCPKDSCLLEPSTLTVSWLVLCNYNLFIMVGMDLQLKKSFPINCGGLS